MDDAQFQLQALKHLLPDHLLALPEEKQIEFISELFYQDHRHQRELKNSVETYLQFHKTINEHYKPLHPHLYHLDGWELLPSFREVVSSGDEQKMRSILTEETSGVFTFNVLTDKCCREFVEEVNHFEVWCKENKLPINRPNTMNRYGVILDDFGFKPVLDELVQKYIQPFATILYPVFGRQLDSHYAYVAEYELGKDANLDLHMDDSEVTLNVCLGQEFTGGDLYFKGVRCDKHGQSDPMVGETYDLKHKVGRGVLHIGRHRHGSRKITSGRRCNLIVWSRSSVQRDAHDYCCQTHSQCYSWCGLHRRDIAQSAALFDEAMREGYITLEMLKMVISGVAGSGKTSTLALLLDQEPATIRRSTPCARRPVQVLPMISDSEDAVSWHVLERMRLKSLLADLVKNHEKVKLTKRYVPTLEAREDSATLESAIETQNTEEPPTSVTTAEKHQIESSSSSQEITQSDIGNHADEESILLHVAEASDTEDELVRLIDQSGGQNVHVRRRLISITDTGGQPQFQDVLPVFLRQTSLYIHVQKLSESLSEKPVIEYYDEQGKLLFKPIPSPLTNEEHVKCAVRSLQSLKHNFTEDKSPKMLFIATHEDQEEKCSESREEKEKRMAKLLLPIKPQSNVIYCGSRMEKVLFGINAKCPGDKENKMVKDIRNIINKLFPCSGQKIPLRWFVLQLKLQEIAGILQRQVITKKECLEAAHRIHLNSQEALDAALAYLDTLNIIFYFREILPNVVFCSIQVVIDKLTELVEHLYKLMEGSDDDCTARMGDWKRFRDFGLINEDILAAFPSHYEPGIFTVNHLLTLFRALLIVADFRSNNDGIQEYFMPCLLHTVKQEEVQKHIVDTKSKIPPLILHFPHCLLSGVFCFTVASLLSSENNTPAPWHLKLQRDGSPKCLYRNIVQFSVHGFLGVVTLVDMFDFIQIIVSSPPSFCSQLCPLVKSAVLASCSKATKLLNYVDCNIEEAVLCRCDSEEGKLHPAGIITDPKGKQWWVCTEDDSVCGELEEANHIWKDKTAYDPVRMNCAGGPHPNECLNFLQVSHALRTLVDWYKLGLELGIAKSDLEVIRLDFYKYGLSRQKDEMIDLWLWSDQQSSWDKLCIALENMNEITMASQIRSMYCTCTY